MLWPLYWVGVMDNHIFYELFKRVSCFHGITALFMLLQGLGTVLFPSNALKQAEVTLPNVQQNPISHTLYVTTHTFIDCP